MKLRLHFFLLCSLLAMSCHLKSQVSSSSYTYYDNTFVLYPFQMGDNIKVKYFTHNANFYYQRWQSNKQVDLICSGAFSETWESNSKPVGFTINNGTPVNYAINSEMDALLIVQPSHIEVIDLDILENGVEIDDGSTLSLDPRNSALHRKIIIQAAKENGYSVFQSQLVYSKKRARNFNNLLYGEQAERRFLAICLLDEKYYNIIVDVPGKLYLNQAAKYTKDVLDHANYSVEYIVNLDTGGKNIFYLREKATHLTKKYKEGLDEATNLIVFYQQ